jgi:hypothetical protein
VIDTSLKSARIRKIGRDDFDRAGKNRLLVGSRSRKYGDIEGSYVGVGRAGIGGAHGSFSVYFICYFICRNNRSGPEGVFSISPCPEVAAGFKTSLGIV